jgi:hypothetical protein
MSMTYSEARGYFTANFWKRHVQLIDDSDDLAGPSRTTKKKAEVVAQSRFGSQNVPASTMLLLTKAGVARLAEECRGRQDEYRQRLAQCQEDERLYDEFQEAQAAHRRGAPRFRQTGPENLDADNERYQAARLEFEEQCETFKQLAPRFLGGPPHQAPLTSTFYFTFEQRGETENTPALGSSPRERSQLGTGHRLLYDVRQGPDGIFQICHLGGMV